MRPFVKNDHLAAYAAVILDFTVYFAATALALIVEPIWLKAVLAVVAGTMISTLFVLGHDAAHGSLVASPWRNRVLARLLFLPALHNYTLWRIQHNRLHHLSPNVRGINSWWPLSPSEYQALPRWRRALERVYRGGGFGLYYLIERWWMHKFIPGTQLDPKLRRGARRDFLLIVIWLAVWVAGLILLAESRQQSRVAALLWGFAVPYLVWNWSMGLTVFLQHTHFAVPWIRNQKEAERFGGRQEALTIHVKFPRWYGLLSHDIMEHPAHHINPLIPFHRLHAAQTKLVELLGNEVVVETVGLRYVRSLMRRCKLYDYDRQEWTDFSGRTTGQTQSTYMAAQHVQ
ncbi:MAG TPA: fatty acid desaturase [Casimicrobiaceae bacterium]|nr:fatty acid desaturase [Casimicrobiaceae bacterium]